ncbi:MAG TPA: sigma-70 family RNA polymerase sigma factor [Polyangia bacterium]|jgi:RNA polymerase sigma-70 factor (ECF subfamily)|nr:sigma-70 family RNA polymerase sigma factor [Polyangia bacterium]
MSETTRPNLKLVAGGKADDARAALRELYAAYGASVYGRCQYLLRDKAKAEDAMQDVFAKALVHWGEFRNESSPLTWLIRIATHHCLNVQRAERAPWHKLFARQERNRSEAHGGPQLLEDRDTVRALLGRLDLESQQAAIHYFVDEMTLEEVAKALGRSVPTVRKRLESVSAMAGRSLKEIAE